MDKNKKLRLLVTTKCPNKCPLCCNNSWDFSKLPIVDRWDYDEIMITGGEPLIMVDKLCELADSIRAISKAMGTNPKIYVYTAVCVWDKFDRALNHIDGIVLTPHNKNDVANFKRLNELVDACTVLHNSPIKDKSLRLNLFPDIKELLKDEDLSQWKVKDMEWIKDCPVPDGEDFRRIKESW